MRLWSLDTGAQIDSAQQPGGLVAVTAVAFVGPLMVRPGGRRNTSMHATMKHQERAMTILQSGATPAPEEPAREYANRDVSEPCDC